jgi:hypothetical protein
MWKGEAACMRAARQRDEVSKSSGSKSKFLRKEIQAGPEGNPRKSGRKSKHLSSANRDLSRTYADPCDFFFWAAFGLEARCVRTESSSRPPGQARAEATRRSRATAPALVRPNRVTPQKRRGGVGAVRSPGLFVVPFCFVPCSSDLMKQVKGRRL